MRNGYEKQGELRPGLHVDLVVTHDLLREKIDVRTSTIYNMEGNRIILAQTTPPLSASHLGRSIEITFLSGTGNRQARLGLTVELNAFLNDYRLFSGNKAPALLLTADKGKVTKYNLRMFHRVRPVPRSDLRLILGSREVSLSNISIGGLCYIYPFDAWIEVGNRFPARLQVGRTVFHVDLKVVRIWSSPELKRSGFKYISAEFVNADKRMNSLLSGKVLEIEREMLSRGLDKP